MDSPETQATLGTRHRTPQEWTVQRHRQHWVQDTGHPKNGQSRDTGNIGYKTQDTPRMDSPETQATLGTRHRTPQEWTVQRHRQHWVQDTGHPKNGQSRDTGNIGYKTQDTPRMDSPETQATLGTRHRTQTTLGTRHRTQTTLGTRHRTQTTLGTRHRTQTNKTKHIIVKLKR